MIDQSLNVLEDLQKLVAAAATNLKIGEKLEEKDSLQEVQKVVAAAATTFLWPFH